MSDEPDLSTTAGQRFSDLFTRVYLTFHRRDGRRNELSGASRGMLLHLAQSGPLTIGEAAAHLDRSQSVVSELVSQLERNGLVARQQDLQDRRRTLVWLTDRGRERLRADAAALDPELLDQAFRQLTARQRDTLLAALDSLVTAAGAPGAGHSCDSCGMPIESGRYCSLCVDAEGELQDFDTRLGRVTEWAIRRGVPEDRAVETARAHLRTMPAWRDHPRLTGPEPA